MELGPCTLVYSAKEGGQSVTGAVWQQRSPHGLVVTTDHRVAIYKGSEHTKEWRFRPGAATRLTHAAVHVANPGRLVAVQGGRTLISWLDSDAAAENPMTAAVPAPVHALLACGGIANTLAVVAADGSVHITSGDLVPGPCSKASNGDGWQAVWAHATADLHVLVVEQRAEGSSSSSISAYRLVVHRITPPSKRGPVGVDVYAAHQLDAAAMGGDVWGAEGAAFADAAYHAHDGALSLLWAGVRQSDSAAAVMWARLLLSNGNGGLAVESVREVATAPATQNGSASPAKKKSRRASTGNSAAAGAALQPRLAYAQPGHVVVLQQGGGHAVPHASAWDATYGMCITRGVPLPDAAPVLSGAVTRVLAAPDGSTLALLCEGSLATCALQMSATSSLAYLISPRAALEGAGDAGEGADAAAAGASSALVYLSAHTAALAVLDGSTKDGDAGAVEPQEWLGAIAAEAEQADQALAAVRSAAAKGDFAALRALVDAHQEALSAQRPAAPQQQQQRHQSKAKGSKRKAAGAGATAAAAAAHQGDCTLDVADAVVGGLLAHPEHLAQQDSEAWGVLLQVLATGRVSGRRHGAQLVSVAQAAQRQDVLDALLRHAVDLPESEIVAMLRIGLRATVAPQRAGAAAAAGGAVKRGRYRGRVQAAEQCMRVVASVPCSEAFLRQALARHLPVGEALLALHALLHALTEGHTREQLPTHSSCAATNPYPPAAALLTWASALVDAHLAALMSLAGSDAPTAALLRELQRVVGDRSHECVLLHSVKGQVARAQAQLQSRQAPFVAPREKKVHDGDAGKDVGGYAFEVLRI